MTILPRSKPISPRVSRLVVAGLGLSAILLDCGAVFGQAPLPKPAEPGRIQRPFEPPEPPSMRPETDASPARRPNLAPDNADQIRFVLRGLAIDGVTVYAEDAFKSLIEPKIGQEISLSDLYAIAEAITARYGDDGYILSQALVPAQRIENGVARIEVVEGVVDKIDFDGDVPADPALMARIAAHIRAEQPLTADALERYLLLLGDLPGYKVRGVLVPSITEGATDLLVEVDHTPVQGAVSIDNRGTRYIGPIQAQFATKLNNAIGLHESIGISIATAGQPDELKSFGASFEMPITTDGTNLNVSAGRAFVAPGHTLKPRDINSGVTSFGIGVSQHLVRSRSTNFLVRADLDAKNVETRENGDRTLLSEDHLRAIHLGWRYELLDSLLTPAFSVVSGRVSQGLNAPGASDRGSAFASRTNGDPTYTKVNLEIQRLQTLGSGFNFLLAGAGQYSFSKLLSPEEFSIGGEEYGRGFDPSEFAGEHGIAGKTELQYGQEGGALPVDSWQLYGFYDFAGIWNKDPTADDSPRHTLASTGGGVRLVINSYLSSYFEIAKPVINRVQSVSEDDGKNPRLFFGLVGKF